MQCQSPTARWRATRGAAVEAGGWCVGLAGQVRAPLRREGGSWRVDVAIAALHEEADWDRVLNRGQTARHVEREASYFRTLGDSHPSLSSAEVGRACPPQCGNTVTVEHQPPAQPSSACRLAGFMRLDAGNGQIASGSSTRVSETVRSASKCDLPRPLSVHPVKLWPLWRLLTRPVGSLANSGLPSWLARLLFVGPRRSSPVRLVRLRRLRRGARIRPRNCLELGDEQRRR